MTISIKPTSSGSTIEQDGGAILSVDGSGNLTVPNNITFSGTVTGVSSYSDSDALSLLNASGSAPVYACRAWVNWSNTQTIRGSGNVSSITDNGVGKYTINMTTAMPDTNYSVVMSVGDDGTSQQMYGTGNVNHTPSFTTSSFRVFTSNVTPTHQDKDHNHVAVFR